MIADIQTAEPQPARVSDTSAQAYQQLGWLTVGTQTRTIFDIVVAAQRNGAADMTRREIWHEYERITGKRIDPGTIAARVKNLIDAGRLISSQDRRICSVSGITVAPVFVPEKQARLCE